MGRIADRVNQRSYNSPTREAKAARTRARILAAASEKFLADGYVKTTTASIANAAGTSEANLFAAFGSKAELLMQVILHDIRDAPDFPVGELSLWQGLIGPDRREAAAARFAAVVRGVMDRSWRSRAVAADAAAVDDAVRELHTRGAENRHAGALWFARDVLQLPAGELERAADGIWALMSVDNYRALVLGRGWSGDQYEAWLAATVRAIAGG